MNLNGDQWHMYKNKYQPLVVINGIYIKIKMNLNGDQWHMYNRVWALLA